MKKTLFTSLGCFGAFLLWTALVCFVDRQAIGPDGSVVGLATVNGAFHRLTGVHMTLYHITDWMGLIPIAVALGFAFLGLGQWIGRRKLQKVDSDLFILGGFYIVTFLLYLLFETVVVNRRPILIDGFLEASYPSSTTMLAICFLPTAMLQLKERVRRRWLRRGTLLLLAGITGFMVVARLISGVHWLSDIVGGGLLSAGLVLLYEYLHKKTPKP